MIRVRVVAIVYHLILGNLEVNGGKNSEKEVLVQVKDFFKWRGPIMFEKRKKRWVEEGRVHLWKGFIYWDLWVWSNLGFSKAGPLSSGLNCSLWLSCLVVERYLEEERKKVGFSFFFILPLKYKSLLFGDLRVLARISLDFLGRGTIWNSICIENAKNTWCMNERSMQF